MGELPSVDNRNEEADAAARELVRCRDASTSLSADAGETNAEEDLEPLTDYGEILKRFRGERREYPAPHHELSRAESVMLRQMQVECVLTPALARHICPEVFADPVCSVCEKELATLGHIMKCGGEVRDGDGQSLDATYPEQVERWLRSIDSSSQRWAIQRLEEALARQKRKGTKDPVTGCRGTPVPDALPGAHPEI